jgi:uncharacterized membrane protein YhaH (DUF805 family)
MKWYFHALRSYAVFRGRARRREYWTFELMTGAIALALFVLAVELGKAGYPYFLSLPLLYIAATAIRSLSSLIRRLHDTGRSGWWFWINLIPLFGPISLLIFTVEDSQPGENRYGPNPKRQPSTEATVSSEMGYLGAANRPAIVPVTTTPVPERRMIGIGDLAPKATFR